MATPTITPSTPATPAASSTPATPSTATPAHSSDRALANFTGNDPAKGGTAPADPTPAAVVPAGTPADPTGAAPAIPDGLTSLLDDLIEKPDPAAAAADPAAPTVADPNTDPLAALQDNPRVKELQAAEATVKSLLTKSEYVKEAAHIEMAIADADVLWKISEGKADVSVILDAAKKTNPQMFPTLLETLRAYVTKETGVPIAAAAAGQPDPATMTDDQKRIAALEKSIADGQRAEQERKANETKAANAERIKTTKTAVLGKITELLKDTVFEGEADRFFAMTGPIIGQEKVNDLIAAVEKGDFKLVEMAIKKAQSAEATRIKTIVGRMIELQKKKGATIPRQASSNSPAAGTEPTPSAAIGDKETRRKAMIDTLKSA